MSTTGQDQPASASASTVAPSTGQASLLRRPSRSAATTTFSLEVFDNEVVPSSLQSIAPILRVAAEIQAERPRVAYLCTYILLIMFLNQT